MQLGKNRIARLSTPDEKTKTYYMKVPVAHKSNENIHVQRQEIKTAITRKLRAD
jgi:hypothetical protein